MKDNPPDLPAAIADAFDDGGASPREAKVAAAERQTASTTDKGHGRTERRTLTNATARSDRAGGNEPYLDWPGLGQCFKLVRERTVHGKGGGKATTETVFGITSPARDQADAGRRLKVVRCHGSVAALFHVRAVTPGEDACRVRSDDAPFILPALRNAVVTLLDQNDATAGNEAAALRRHAAHPAEAIALVRGYRGYG